ncbi:MAG: polysaccharide deacetylase family protein [Fusobacteriaceae bacterium]|jgi:peptidoglycan/xylan/chitin deacetylase (PgdA/CDA1 family)|nr:polysaccharide deacetylase family protein [Fusobacteriaceae bacterium]
MHRIKSISRILVLLFCFCFTLSADPIYVLLTFDDGPGPYTETLLDELKKMDVHATFFVLGALAKKNPDVVRRMAEEGHTVGNHTWSHPDLFTLNLPKQLSQVARTNEVLEKLTDRKVKYFRPPYGNASKELEKSINLVTVRWGPYDTKDWAAKNRSAAIVANKIMQGLLDGSIILLHDPHKTTVEGVALALERIREQGLDVKFVSLDEYFDLKNIAYAPGMVVSSFVPGKKAGKSKKTGAPVLASASRAVAKAPEPDRVQEEILTRAEEKKSLRALKKNRKKDEETIASRLHRIRNLSEAEIELEKERTKQKYKKRKWFL